jgi:hypothetical protein
MDGDVRRRMSVWCLLTFASVVLVIIIGLSLFFEPGHGGKLSTKVTDRCQPS